MSYNLTQIEYLLAMFENGYITTLNADKQEVTSILSE